MEGAIRRSPSISSLKSAAIWAAIGPPREYPRTRVGAFVLVWFSKGAAIAAWRSRNSLGVAAGFAEAGPVEGQELSLASQLGIVRDSPSNLSNSRESHARRGRADLPCVPLGYSGGKAPAPGKYRSRIAAPGGSAAEHTADRSGGARTFQRAAKARWQSEPGG